MKKNITFKKDVTFKKNISEVISIALDDDLKLEKNNLKGKFKVYGEYLNFDEKIPFDIDIPYNTYLDECYKTDNAFIDVSDFYYEIIDNNKLSINIEISLDNLREEVLENTEIVNNDLIVKEESVDEIFDYHNDFNTSYMTYRVYIVRESDTIDSIIEKYNITKEELAKYNVLNNVNIGDKLIIPNEKNK